MAMRPTVVDQHDLQGNILAGYGSEYRHACYVFVRVLDPVPARCWLADLAGRVQDAVPWTSKPDATLNVAVSYQGLRAFGVPEQLLVTFPEEFRLGMAARAQLLRDTGTNDPEQWEDDLRPGRLQVLVTTTARTPAALDQHRTELLDHVRRPGSGLELAHEVGASLLRREGDKAFAREHFGFLDGLAQPSIAARGLERGHKAGPTVRAGQGTPTRRGGWSDVAVGEFVLGYRDEDGVLPEAPAPPLGRNGSFMVVRKLDQDVALFNRAVAEAATRCGEDPELIAAKIVGRWRDGTPLVRAPADHRLSLTENPARTATMNDFRYAGDEHGDRCPLGAHIRRANPRDAFGVDGLLTRRHRIIRRGMPYGPPFDGAEGDPRPDRGLMFVCYQASIARQFELIQASWINDGDAFELGAEKDYLLAAPDPRGYMTLPGPRPNFLAPNRGFVTLKGGEYFFAPGLAALRAIAAGF